ncbi:polyprenol reductase 2-like isoform X3 [Carya illinoinensis]|uniref:polyprenol reductase 2-like isoform X3 n=1 Tax=Carya illinoinensis TaxID=32201 RepID=UPI001C722296|nr:polyprenol reductase 2-like isoform X3 [Carya illinoinensis]
MNLWLVGLLRAAWIAGTLPILIASVPSSRLCWFRDTLLGFAKRGKTLQSSSKRFTVPQRFFRHFYWVAVVWTTLLLGSTWMYANYTAQLVSEVSEPLLYSNIASYLTGGSHISSWSKSHSTSIKQRLMIWRSVFLLLLMEVQVLRRLVETIYVFNYSPSARMHILGYLTGLLGKNQMPAIEIHLWEFVNPLMKLGWCQWIGAAIFCWGWIHQQRCHSILVSFTISEGSLRDHTEQVDEYVIPHGDWFEIVSSPHYLAEIVIYAGVVVASGGADLTIWLLFAFAVANLVFAAAETHRWYLRKFDNYPSNRLAVIPFLY